MAGGNPMLRSCSAPRIGQRLGEAGDREICRRGPDLCRPVKPRIATHFPYPLEPAKGLCASRGAASRILSPERGPIDPMTAACSVEKGESHPTTAKFSSGIFGFALPFVVLCLLNTT